MSMLVKRYWIAPPIELIYSYTICLVLVIDQFVGSPYSRYHFF